jgi:hypothetical protein
MKPYLYLLGLLMLGGISAPAQSSDEQAIATTIKTLFDGMYEGDSSKVHSAFTGAVNTATIFRDKAGAPVLRQEASLDGFLKGVGTPHAEKWTEEFWDVKINIDGDMAQAWCDYAFYLDHKFSHCGVDAFLMHKTKNGWKIFHLADTRKREGCVIPKEIVAKHNQ